MNIHHIYPVDDLLMGKWPKLSRHNLNAPITNCDVIYCASVTQLIRAYRDKWGHNLEVPIVCLVWDLPSNWRSWCRDDTDYNLNLWRDGDISAKLDLLYKCDNVISASYATKSALDMYGIKSDVLYHFYDSEALDAVNAGEKKNRIIQISRYAINKRFDLTLKMWKAIQDKHKDWELMFVGFGDGTKLRELAQELGAERFSLLEDVPHYERIKLMKESKILVSPSLHEGFGLTPLEAQHCGVKTICSAIPTTFEFEYCHSRNMFLEDNLDEYIDVVDYWLGSDICDVSVPREDLQIQAWTKRFDNYFDSLEKL